MDMLQITDLKKSFGDKTVLDGLSLTVPEGSIFGFVGKNGAGKTTAMKLILGLLKADAGQITVAGERVQYGNTPTNRHIGYLPDVPEFYGFMTAPEYLNFCGQISALQGNGLKNRCQELLELVGLAGERHRIGGFSRGMKQRLGIAQALLGNPRLLICDEPTSALDPVGRKEILDILLTVRQQTTVLFSTHILSDVERICTDVAFLQNGCIQLQGKVAEIRASYRTDTYAIELERPADAAVLRQAFPSMVLAGQQLTFDAVSCDVSKVLRLVADQHLSLIKFERVEPTLESLFMEVVET